MVRIGDRFANPVTKERLIRYATAAATGGEVSESDLHLATPAAPRSTPDDTRVRRS